MPPHTAITVIFKDEILYYVARAVLVHLILLLQIPRRWDCRHIHHKSLYNYFISTFYIFTYLLCMLVRHLHGVTGWVLT